METKSWALPAIDSRVKCEHITSNFVESWNAWVGHAQFKPPITMLETIRTQIMNLIYTRGQQAKVWEQHLTPDVLGRIKSISRVSRHAEVIRGFEYEF